MRLLGRLVHPGRQAFASGDDADDEDEIEGWVEAAARPYFSGLEGDFVDRALGLGVSGGMVLDLGSPLGLVAMKMLWKREDLLAMGVYPTRAMADRARETAIEWGLGDRMFFQVGEPFRFRFKDGYFDVVVSDGFLHRRSDPARVLSEVARIAKPGGAVLIRDLLRPNRFRIASHIRRHGRRYPERLQGVHARAVRSGFTPGEFLDLSRALGSDRVRVLADATHVVMERTGRDDPESWVMERERYR